MNIFFLDRKPDIAAQMMHDKHVVKMILETAQILSTVVHQYRANVEGLYKPTHENHPCVLWAGKSLEHFWWLYEHGSALCWEYAYRYGKDHKSSAIIAKAALEMQPTTWGWNTMEEPPQAMPDEFKVPGDAVQAYRNYYLGRKVEQSRWTRRPVPEIFRKRYEEIQMAKNILVS